MYEVGSRRRNNQVHLHLSRCFVASEQSPEKHWCCLPPGTLVGDWRVVGCHGHGAYGIVYRAVRVGDEAAREVALKVALYPWDPRFMREVGLLSLVHHASVPLLVDHGFWKHPSGAVYPFIVMEWIEGTPLYEWAREQAPSSRRVSRVLGQLARALQATHEASAVHRDVLRIMHLMLPGV
jgi:serine/threonine protein kinase